MDHLGISINSINGQVVVIKVNLRRFSLDKTLFTVTTPGDKNLKALSRGGYIHIPGIKTLITQEVALTTLLTSLWFNLGDKKISIVHLV